MAHGPWAAHSWRRAEAGLDGCGWVYWRWVGCTMRCTCVCVCAAQVYECVFACTHDTNKSDRITSATRPLASVLSLLRHTTSRPRRRSSSMSDLKQGAHPCTRSLALALSGQRGSFLLVDHNRDARAKQNAQKYERAQSPSPHPHTIKHLEHVNVRPTVRAYDDSRWL